MARGNNGAERSAENKAGLGRLALLAPFLKPYKGVIAGALVALIVAAAATLAIAPALRRIVDMGFSPEQASLIDQYFLSMLGVITVLAVATFARFFLVTWLGERLAADVRLAVYSQVIGLDPAFFDSTKSGEITSRLTNDITLVQSALGSTASVALRNLLLFVGGVLIMALTSPLLLGLAFVVVPVVVLPILLLGRRVRRLSRETQDRIADVTDCASETLAAVHTVQSFTQEDAERRRFGARVGDAFRTSVRRIRMRSWLTVIVIFFIFGAVDLVLWVGAKQVVAGTLTSGELGQFVVAAIIAAGAVGALSEVYGELQQAAGAAERLTELLYEVPAIRAPEKPLAMPEPSKGALAFEGVTFHYPARPDTPALAGFTLAVGAGETVALVGPSGAGKSTVFQLLMRFYDPQSGSVSIDGVPIREADPLAVRARLGIVPQDTVIFAASALDNIRYGRRDASDDEVRHAARAALAEEFLDRLPEGFDTYLGERGVRLSGGQRQRIAIARAILRDAPILLLDEATSALDAESELAVQQALEALMKNRTTLVIAHRLATVLKADRIVVMDQGRVVAVGTHQELVAKGGLYARLAELQFSTPNGERLSV